jgi:hypothetical protein
MDVVLLSRRPFLLACTAGNCRELSGTVWQNDCNF